MTSSSVFNKVSTFEVADFSPWLPDHSPLYFTIEVHNPVAKDTQNDSPKSKAPKQYIWSNESSTNFFNTLQNTEFQAKLDKFSQLDGGDPNNLVNYITEVLNDAAEKTKIKYVKQKENKDQT